MTASRTSRGRLLLPLLLLVVLLVCQPAEARRGGGRRRGGRRGNRFGNVLLEGTFRNPASKSYYTNPNVSGVGDVCAVLGIGAVTSVLDWSFFVFCFPFKVVLGFR